MIVLRSFTIGWMWLTGSSSPNMKMAEIFLHGRHLMFKFENDFGVWEISVSWYLFYCTGVRDVNIKFSGTASVNNISAKFFDSSVEIFGTLLAEFNTKVMQSVPAVLVQKFPNKIPNQTRIRVFPTWYIEWLLFCLNLQKSHS